MHPSSNTWNNKNQAGRGMVFGIIIIALIFFSLVIGNYLLPGSHSTTTTDLPKKISQTISSITSQVKPNDLSDPDNKLLYVRDPNFDQENDLQAVLINADGSDPQQLDISPLRGAYKHPASQLVFYTTTESENSFNVLNLKSNTTTNYIIPITHPDPEAFVSFYDLKLEQIAPDGSGVIAQVDFRTECPEFSPPPGFQGGFGPCMPDPTDDAPAGMYFIDLEKETATFLAETITSPYWQLETNGLFYNDLAFQDTGLKRFDLKTKKITTIDQATTFGYGAHLLSDGKTLIRASGETGDGLTPTSFSQIAIVDLVTNDQTIIDSGKWADVQPIFTMSPNDNYVIYYRTPLLKGLAIGTLYVYNTQTKENKQLSPASQNMSYRISGVWIDDDTFVTTVNNVNPDNFDNQVSNLVRFDLDSNTVTELTDTSNISKFTD